MNVMIVKRGQSERPVTVGVATADGTATGIYTVSV